MKLFIKPEKKKEEVQEEQIKVIVLPESITIKELAQHMGIRLEYASMVLNGKRSPAGAEERFNQALDELIAARERADSQKG